MACAVNFHTSLNAIDNIIIASITGQYLGTIILKAALAAFEYHKVALFVQNFGTFQVNLNASTTY